MIGFFKGLSIYAAFICAVAICSRTVYTVYSADILTAEDVILSSQITSKSELRDKRRGERLQNYAYRAIKDAILSGKLRADVSLAEERLAAELQISRTPVREALAILEHEGLIETTPYQGLFVKSLTVTEFLEMYETYELIEAALARRAAMNATAKDIADMEALLDQAEQAIPHDPAAHMAACRQFLRKLGECSQQRHMSAVLLSIDEQADVYM